MMTSAKRSKPPANHALRYCWGGRFNASNNVGWHEHVETELVAVHAGRCRINVDGQKLDGERGALFILPAGVPQYQETLEPSKTTFIGLLAPAELFDDSSRVLTIAPEDPVFGWIEQLCDGPLLQPPMSDDVTLRLLEILLRRIGEFDEMLGTRAQQHPAISKAVSYLKQNLVQPLQLAELAQHVGVSASHLGALFNEQCGCSPMQYLQRCRLERACWLLDNPYLRIHEVAEACGYEDVNYFVRLFRQCYGQPPGRWRNARTSSPRASSR